MALEKVCTSAARPVDHPESPGRDFWREKSLLGFFFWHFVHLRQSTSKFPQTGGNADI